MKTPITYYGGKQLMCQDILPMIPKHKLYCEPFVGGGAVYWSKTPSWQEVINDTNDFVVSFYRYVQLHFNEFVRQINSVLCSRAIHREMYERYKNPVNVSMKDKAVAFFFLVHHSFSSSIGSTFPIKCHALNPALKFSKKKALFTKEMCARLKHTVVESIDALKCIKGYDHPDTFFYVDPPYMGARQGHYAGYTIDHFKDLLTTLSAIKGNFILSCYPHEIEKEFCVRYGWQRRVLNLTLGASCEKGRRKEEVLIWNYPLNTLFL